LKIIWVLENIKSNKNSNDYYTNSRLNVLLLLSSVSLWKRYHPEDNCVLYADDSTIDVLSKLKVLSLWDSILPIPFTPRINKDVFWASSKLQVLASQDEPVIIMDNDTHVFTRLKDYLDLTKPYVCNLEIGKGYYPTAIDVYVQKLSYKARWQTGSVNVSFLNLPDPEFTKEYANLSIKFMEEFTEMEAPNSQYLIFAEQLLLAHLLKKKKIDFKSILSTYWDCKAWEWGEDHDNGIWNIYDSGKYFKHYGPLKGFILNNKGGESYEREIKHLENCVNIPNLDLSSIKGR
jgi:hypothetical protein